MRTRSRDVPDCVTPETTLCFAYTHCSTHCIRIQCFVLHLKITRHSPPAHFEAFSALCVRLFICLRCLAPLLRRCCSCALCELIACFWGLFAYFPLIYMRKCDDACLLVMATDHSQACPDPAAVSLQGHRVSLSDNLSAASVNI